MEYLKKKEINKLGTQIQNGFQANGQVTITVK